MFPQYVKQRAFLRKQGGHQLNRGFNIDFCHSVGNLHIQLHGEFNGMCAWELIKTIRQQPPGEGRIFINTANISRILPDGVDLFKTQMARRNFPSDWLYFKGEQGFKIAPDGSRILICKKAQNPTTILSQKPLEIGWTLRRVK